YSSRVCSWCFFCFFFFQAEDGIRDFHVTGVQTCALPIYHQFHAVKRAVASTVEASRSGGDRKAGVIWHTQGSGKSLLMAFYAGRSEEHTSELQSRENLVCRLLLEKKKKQRSVLRVHTLFV